MFPPSQNLQPRHRPPGDASGMAKGNILESNSFAMLSGDEPVIRRRRPVVIFWTATGREEADEGAYRRWRVWGIGGGRVSHPGRRGVRPGHYDLRGGRADGWRA